MLLFAQQIDYFKSMSHRTMPFHFVQLRRTAFFSISGYIKRLRH